MQSFMNLMSTLATCGTVLLVVFLVLLAMPQSRMRSVALEVCKWGMACGLAVLTISPIDIAPDFIPVIGWMDDLGYVLGAAWAIYSALDERRQRALMEP